MRVSTNIFFQNFVCLFCLLNFMVAFILTKISDSRWYHLCSSVNFISIFLPTGQAIAVEFGLLVMGKRWVSTKTCTMHRDQDHQGSSNFHRKIPPIRLCPPVKTCTTASIFTNQRFGFFILSISGRT